MDVIDLDTIRREKDEPYWRARLTGLIQLNDDLTLAAMEAADGDRERAISILETAIMGLRATRDPDYGRYEPTFVIT